LTIKKTENATKFLKRVRDVYKGNYKIYMILDNWSVHKTKAFNKTALDLNIELHYIPTSAPYYNKIELNLFGQIQKDVQNCSSFDNISEIKREIVEFVDDKYNRDAFHDNIICL